MSHKQLIKVADYYQYKYNYKLSTAGFFSDVGDRITKVIKKFTKPKSKLRDFMEISSVPTDVESIPNRSKEQALAYKDQLERLLSTYPGEVPEDFKIEIRNASHDLGSYPEVVCVYNLGDEEAQNVATWLVDNQPNNWDKEALRSLETREYADRSE